MKRDEDLSERIEGIAWVIWRSERKNLESQIKLLYKKYKQVWNGVVVDMLSSFQENMCSNLGENNIF